MPIRRVKGSDLGKPVQVVTEKVDEAALYSIARVLMGEFGYNGHTGIATVIEMIAHAGLRDHEFLRRAIPELAKRNGKKLPDEIVNLPKD